MCDRAGTGEGGLRAGGRGRPGGDHGAGSSVRGRGESRAHVCVVARVVRTLVANGTVPGNCKGKVVSCAARSTCGKPGFVRCLFPTDTCVVDPVTLLGTCAENPTLACVVDLDCGAKCKTKSSADGCTQRGGTLGGTGSCCAACAS